MEEFFIGFLTNVTANIKDVRNVRIIKIKDAFRGLKIQSSNVVGNWQLNLMHNLLYKTSFD